MGHVRMMAAVQPFISGAISKTVNLPESATVDDIAQVYFEGWRLGLKALAVYRDNCKVSQPLSGTTKVEAKAAAPEVRVEYRPRRQRLPKSRRGKTVSFEVAGAEGYITANSYDDGRLGEVFLKLGKQGSTLAGVMDAFSIAISIARQYGVPLETYVQKLTNLRFEPAGVTDDPDVRMAQSIMDYIFRRLALDYLNFDERAELGIYAAAERARYVATGSYMSEEDEAQLLESETLRNDAADNLRIDEAGPLQPSLLEAPPRTTAELMESLGQAVDAPLCLTCGTKMRPSGSCYVCEGCGATSGCS
jgi:ribonucleoside-diphosphate reductase alpha chain